MNRQVKKYATALIDPPWPEQGAGQFKRGADKHYPLMKVEEIKALRIGDIMLPNAHVYLWVTNNFLHRGMEVIEAWGFRYVTCVTWGKVSKDGAPRTGIGQYYRGATEHLLFAKRGSVAYRTRSDGKRAQGKTLVLEERGEHSAKPEVFRETIEVVSPGPYVELFARRKAKNWDAWGLEADQPVRLKL